MNTLFLTSLFLSSAEASDETFVSDPSQEIMGKSKPKNEIRLGLCGGLSCIVGLQLEYGTPQFTVGASSLILANSVFAQYNVLSLNNDRFRAVVGARGLYVTEAAFLTPEILGLSVYVGPELHLKHLTVRGTAGSIINEYRDIYPSFSVEILYNFILQ